MAQRILTAEHGLTDKADSVEYLIEQIAKPRGIEAADIPFHRRRVWNHRRLRGQRFDDDHPENRGGKLH